MLRFFALPTLAAVLLLTGPAVRAQEAAELYEQLQAGKCQPALASLRTEAEAGKAAAQANLALAFYFGHCVPKDRGQTVQWTLKAAEQGLAWAQRNAGYLYRDGEGGLAQDDRLALVWFQKAAAQGDNPSLDELGDIFFYGRGVPKDLRAAADAYRKAATAGHAAAQYSLGNMAEYGNGMPKDEAAAVAWYRKAAEQGYATAQFALGKMLSDGRGAAKSEREAGQWYRKAAEQGHAKAQNNLGHLYEHGQGVLQDDAEALAWYERAARQGNAWGQRNLGLMLRDGKGVPRDPIRAHAWLNLAGAAEEPHPGASKDRDELAEGLSPAQLADAQRLAREWKAGAAMGAPRVKVAAAAPAAPAAPRPAEAPVAGNHAFPARPAAQPGRTSCNTRCVNGDCYRTYDNGRQVRFQAKQKWNPLNNQFEWDSGSC